MNVEIPNVTCIDQSAKAIFVDFGGKKAWIPQSLVHDDSEVWKDGDTGTLVIPEWFAIKNGLDPYVR